MKVQRISKISAMTAYNGSVTKEPLKSRQNHEDELTEFDKHLVRSISKEVSTKEESNKIIDNIFAGKKAKLMKEMLSKC